MIFWIVIGLTVLIVVVGAYFFWNYLNLDLWLNATSSNVPVSIMHLIGMKIRSVPSDSIIVNMIRAHKAGFKVTMTELENHFQAKGDIPKVVESLVRAKNAGINLDFKSIGQIDLSGRDVSKIVSAVVKARNAGIPMDIGNAVQIDLSGRDVSKVLDAVIKAKGAGIDLSLRTAVQMDLAGIDIDQEVDTAVKTKVLRSDEICAIPIDGVEIKFRADITVKSNLLELLGSAGDDTIKKRIEQRLIARISSMQNYQEVLQRPNEVANILESDYERKKIEEGTKYFVESIEIVDIKVGQDIGAKLEEEQARADVEKAKAKAEEAKVKANAKRFEMEVLERELDLEKKKAEISEMHAKYKLMEAEAQVQHSIAEAFKNGNLGALDFYKLKNLQADTKMRNNLSSEILDDQAPTHL
ncbi:MAG: flotillin-like FloA family protein [Bacteroidia bacterium]